MSKQILKCIQSSSLGISFTKGKFYTFKDGKLETNDKDTYYSHFTSLLDINKRCGATFILWNIEKKQDKVSSLKEQILELTKEKIVLVELNDGVLYFILGNGFMLYVNSNKYYGIGLDEFNGENLYDNNTYINKIYTVKSEDICFALDKENIKRAVEMNVIKLYWKRDKYKSTKPIKKIKSRNVGKAF